MKLVWSTLAIADLVSIRTYISEFSPQGAETVGRRILEAVNNLRKYPNLGKASHRTDVRKLIVKNSPYIIPYRVVDGEIEILEVFDARQCAPRTN